MSFTRVVCAAFLGSLLAGVFLLAWRSSKETGKSIPASFADVPAEAQKVASTVRSKAGDVVNKARGAGCEEESGLGYSLDDALQ